MAFDLGRWSRLPAGGGGGPSGGSGGGSGGGDGGGDGGDDFGGDDFGDIGHDDIGHDDFGDYGQSPSGGGYGGPAPPSGISPDSVSVPGPGEHGFTGWGGPPNPHAPSEPQHVPDLNNPREAFSEYGRGLRSGTTIGKAAGLASMALGLPNPATFSTGIPAGLQEMGALFADHDNDGMIDSGVFAGLSVDHSIAPDGDPAEGGDGAPTWYERREQNRDWFLPPRRPQPQPQNGLAHRYRSIYTPPRR